MTPSSAKAPQCAAAPKSAEVNAIAKPFTGAPLRVSRHAFLETTPKDLYPFLVEPDKLPLWIEGVTGVTYDHAHSSSTGELGVGSLRSLDFGGTPDKERVVISDPGVRIGYRILSGPPVTAHLAIMTLKPSDGGVIFSWFQYYDPSNLIASLFITPRVRSFVKGSMKNLIASLGGEDLGSCD